MSADDFWLLLSLLRANGTRIGVSVDKKRLPERTPAHTLPSYAPWEIWDNDAYSNLPATPLESIPR